MTKTEIARSLVGTKWIHQGRDPATGLDCLGFLMIVFGVDPRSEPADYSRDPHNDLLDARLEAHLGPPRTDGVRAEDVIKMAWGRRSRHGGFIVEGLHGGLNLIHADSIFGEVVEHPFDAKWIRRVRGVYRHE